MMLPKATPEDASKALRVRLSILDHPNLLDILGFYASNIRPSTELVDFQNIAQPLSDDGFGYQKSVLRGSDGGELCRSGVGGRMAKSGTALRVLR